MPELDPRWESTPTSDEYRQILSDVVGRLRTGFCTGTLVFLTGHAEDKGYRLVEVLGDKTAFVSVGTLLSGQLLEVPRTRRPLKAQQLLAEKVAQGPVCFYDIEILFDPGMDLDVMSSLKTLAKGRAIYVDWPGGWSLEERQLTFAVPEDPAYREYPLEFGFGVVDLSGDHYPPFGI